MSMYDKKHYNIVISLQLIKINGEKKTLKKLKNEKKKNNNNNSGQRTCIDSSSKKIYKWPLSR